MWGKGRRPQEGKGYRIKEYGADTCLPGIIVQKAGDQGTKVSRLVRGIDLP